MENYFNPITNPFASNLPVGGIDSGWVPYEPLFKTYVNGKGLYRTIAMDIQKTIVNVLVVNSKQEQIEDWKFRSIESNAKFEFDKMINSQPPSIEVYAIDKESNSELITSIVVPKSDFNEEPAEWIKFYNEILNVIVKNDIYINAEENNISCNKSLKTIDFDCGEYKYKVTF